MLRTSLPSRACRGEAIPTGVNARRQDTGERLMTMRDESTVPALPMELPVSFIRLPHCSLSALLRAPGKILSCKRISKCDIIIVLAVELMERKGGFQSVRLTGNFREVLLVLSEK